MARVKVRAKGKVKRQQEASDAEKIQKKLDDAIKVVERQDDTPKSTITAKELVNVIADTVERTWEDMNALRYFSQGDHVRLNAEETGRIIAGSLLYGIGNFGGRVRVKEVEATPSYCREHK